MARAMLVDYSTELPVKGVDAALTSPDAVTVAGPDGAATLRYLPSVGSAAPSVDATITFACRPTMERERGACHFDLGDRLMVGVATPLSEDFRDFLRRRTVRIYTDRRFQSLMPANVARLKARLDHA
jgi:hypothetical protein